MTGPGTGAKMTLNDLLRGKDINPEQVLVMRHRPSEPQLKRVLPWLAAERPDLFNAYQQTQNEKVERAVQLAKYVASFIGREPGKALFIGLYSMNGCKRMTYRACCRLPVIVELTALGMRAFSGKNVRSTFLWFDLALTDFYEDWKGKLIVGWPPPERSWWRRAHRNVFPVLAVHDESTLGTGMPSWKEIVLTWEQLSILPSNWRARLSEWRAIYYIFDTSDGRGYVGSAYGDSNLLGRWLGYAALGHGGNRSLRQRDPKHFQFSILQRVSPDEDPADVIRLEATWKERLHTRRPYGLNDN
jgi:hypothetical protein